MRVVEVADEAGLDAFVRLGHETYGGMAVPLPERTERAWHRGRHPHRHAITLLLALDGELPVGRAIAHRDDRLDARLGTRALVFGALEAAVPDVLHTLVDAIEARAAAVGAQEVFGPAQLLPNQSGGVITAGFEERGFLDAVWNPRWVPEALEARGMRRWYEADTWVVDVLDEDGPSDSELDAAGIRIDEVSRIGLGRGLRALLPLSRRLHANLAQLGCRTLRSTPVGRQNPGSARQFSRFGGRPLHATAYYRKLIAPRPTAS